MSVHEHFKLLASYNQWMNEKVYEAAAQLGEDELLADRGAFFGSILGTLNHLVVGDTIWLKRFATHPACREVLKPIAGLPTPTALDQLLFTGLAGLREHRQWLDTLICDWVASLSEDDLDYVLSYRNTKGVPFKRPFSQLMLHFFNHQTHHRGQVSTLLSQAGVDLGVTDLLALIPNEGEP